MRLKGSVTSSVSKRVLVCHLRTYYLPPVNGSTYSLNVSCSFTWSSFIWFWIYSAIFLHSSRLCQHSSLYTKNSDSHAYILDSHDVHGWADYFYLLGILQNRIHSSLAVFLPTYVCDLDIVLLLLCLPVSTCTILSIFLLYLVLASRILFASCILAQILYDIYSSISYVLSCSCLGTFSKPPFDVFMVGRPYLLYQMEVFFASLKLFLYHWHSQWIYTIKIHRLSRWYFLCALKALLLAASQNAC